MKANLIRSWRSSLVLLAIVLPSVLLGACKKDSSATPDPAQALTAKNTEALRNTEWYGRYRNKGETLGNNQGYRGYALTLGTDSSFKFYSAGFAHDGFWSVAGNVVRFRFATGARNTWRAELDGEVLKNTTVPAPDNFSFNGMVQRIGPPPADVLGHTWQYGPDRITLRASVVSAPTGSSPGSTVDYGYTVPHIKSKIFNFWRTSGHVLVIVDGQKLWFFDGYANAFQFNY